MARLLLCLFVLFNASTANAQSGRLGSIVQDVRTAPASNYDDDDDHHYHCDDDNSSLLGNLFDETFGNLFLHCLTSPLLIPRSVLEDEFPEESYFPRFPYDNVPGYMMLERGCGGGINLEAWRQYNIDSQPAAEPLQWQNRPRTWAARFRAEYADNFSDTQQTAGHLLLSTSSRFGLDTGMSFLEERRFDGGRDQLWLGDCNLILRFAQSERAQWRVGVGFNWLDDPVDTNFGFNFTYGFDLFPVDPFVLSTTLDWGTLGHTSIFHFRTTVGVTFHGIEAYTGYEHYGIGRTHIDSLVSGVRIWF